MGLAALRCEACARTRPRCDHLHSSNLCMQDKPNCSRALKLFGEVLMQGLPPDAFFYFAAICACIWQGDPCRNFLLMVVGTPTSCDHRQLFQGIHYVPDGGECLAALHGNTGTCTYTTALCTCRTCQGAVWALQLLGETLVRGLPPFVFTYTVVFGACNTCQWLRGPCCSLCGGVCTDSRQR